MFGRFCFREETSFKYFARIKFSKFHWKDTVPVAVFFRTRLKKVFTSLARGKYLKKN